jgi:mono/diheme cytochrome c family protein
MTPRLLMAGMAGAALVLVIVATYFWQSAGEASEVVIDPGNPTQVALGRKVYEANCASCHGSDLKGQPDWQKRGADGLLPAPPHDASGHTWHHPDQMLFEITKEGPAKMVGKGYKSTMPGFGAILSDAQIAASLAYIKSRWPREILARNDKINQQANAQK